MKNLLTLLLYGLMVLGSVLCLNTHDVEAKTSYWREFEKKYAKPRSGEPGDAVLAEEIAAARCNLCHAGAKKTFNAYGLAIRQAKKAERDATKAEGARKSKIEWFRAALDRAEDMKSDPRDQESLTFGSLLDQGKLPVEKISADSNWYDKTKSSGAGLNVPEDHQILSGQITNFIWSGALSDTSAKVASRIKSAGTEVRLRVSTSADLSNPVYSAYKTADSEEDNMVHLDISGLTEETQYYYAIEDRNGNTDDLIGKFQTIKMGAYSFTFAAASCADTGSDHFVFDNIASKPIQFFMNTGDLHYRDITVNNPSLYATGYKALFNSAKQRNLYQNNSFVYIWDDHDFGSNGSWGGSRGKPAAQLAYRQYVPSHDLILPKAGNGIYRAFSVGRVRFVVTDLRSYSDKGGDALAPGRTLMGSDQKAWFKQELLNSRDTHKLIVWVSTTPWIGSPQSNKDRWYSFCAEREELANFFRDNDLDKRMCIISGDAHMLAADDGSNNTYGGDGSPMFPVFHAAAMDSSGSSKGGPYSEGTYPGRSQYGLFKVTDNGGDTVTFNFKGIKATSSTAGKVLIDYTFDSPKAPPKR